MAYAMYEDVKGVIMKMEAEKFYLEKRGNCAQSVAFSWSKYMEGNEIAANDLSTSGLGKAPEGMCGAIYAAQGLVEASLQDEIIEKFKKVAQGHITCKDIRKSRALSCVECVGTAADLLHRISQDNH